MSAVWDLILAVVVLVCAVIMLWAALRKRPQVFLWSVAAMMAAQAAMQWFIGNHWIAYLSAAVAIAGTVIGLYRHLAQ